MKTARKTCLRFSSLLLGLLSFSACGEQVEPTPDPVDFRLSGIIKSGVLDEISGIEILSGQDLLVHNDDGNATVFVINLEGKHKASIRINDAKNRNWEDLTTVPGDDGPLLLIADTGNKKLHYKSIRLLLVRFPQPDDSGAYPERLDLLHKVKLKYPDGRRDSEAVAYDSSSKQVLILSKSDFPPRIYAVELEKLMKQEELTLEFLGEIPSLRPPTPLELISNPKRGAILSQPTGLDISADGRLAAVITYRSLYLFEREDSETWVEAFQKLPLEIQGPAGKHEEAVAFTPEEDAVIVTTEKLPAPLYRYELNREDLNQPASRP